MLEAIGHYLFEEIYLHKLLIAAKYPFMLTAASMPVAVFAGLILALMRNSRRKVLSLPAAAYIETIRGTPLLVQMYLVYYSLPLLGPAFTLDAIPAAIICLSGNYAAYEAEIHRAGLAAVEAGQREAALSIGMSERQSFLLVVLPQAFRIVVPPVINDLIAMLKDSCIASVITVPELLNRAQAIARGNQNYAEMYVAAAVIYMILSLACYLLGRYAERRLKPPSARELHLDQVHGH